MGMGGVMGGWRRDGDEGSDGGGEWGVGEGVGTDGRGGSAAGPSSVCALVVCVRTGRLPACSLSVCVLVVLSVGVRYVWVARRHCLRGARLRPGWG